MKEKKQKEEFKDEFKDGLDYRFSHDPKDAAHFTDRAFFVISPKLKRMKMVKDGVIIGIRDENKKHYHFLKAWDNLEIDIHTRWSINNGVMGLKLKISNNNKNHVSYMVKLTLKMVEKILSTPLGCFAICDESQNVLLHLQPVNLKQLAEFYVYKKQGDKFFKEKNLSPKGWIID